MKLRIICVVFCCIQHIMSLTCMAQEFHSHCETCLYRGNIGALFPDMYPYDLHPGMYEPDLCFRNATWRNIVRMYHGGGWNLGNSLDSHAEGVTGVTETETLRGNPIITPELIEMMKEAGLGFIRVPVTWYPHMDNEGNVDPAWMARVKEVVDYVINEDMVCIINVHHDTGAPDPNAPGKAWLKATKSNYEQNHVKFEKLWNQIASAFKDYDPAQLLFEGYNELVDEYGSFGYPYKNDPRTDGSNTQRRTESYDAVNNYAKSFITTVRATGGNNEERVLLISPYAAAGLISSIDLETFKQARLDTEPLKLLKKHELLHIDKTKLMISVHLYPPLTKTIDEGGNTITIDKTMAEVEQMADNYLKQIQYLIMWHYTPIVITELGTSNINNYPHDDYTERPELLKHFVRSMGEKMRETFHGALYFYDSPFPLAQPIARVPHTAPMAYWMGFSDKMDRAVPTFTRGDLVRAQVEGTRGYPIFNSDQIYREMYAIHGSGYNLYQNSDEILKLGLNTASGAKYYYVPLTPEVIPNDTLRNFLLKKYEDLKNHPTEEVTRDWWRNNFPLIFPNYPRNTVPYNRLIKEKDGVKYLKNFAFFNDRTVVLPAVSDYTGMEHFYRYRLAIEIDNTNFNGDMTIKNMKWLTKLNLSAIGSAQSNISVKKLTIDNCPLLSGTNYAKGTNILDLSGSIIEGQDVFPKNESYYISDLEELQVTNCPQLHGLSALSTRLKKVDLRGSNISTLRLNQGFLTLDDILIDTKLKEFVIPRNRITESDMPTLYNMLSSDGLTSIQLNGGKYNRRQHSNDETDIYAINTNLIREIDMEQMPKSTQIFQMRHNLLTNISIGNSFNKLRQIHINNNMLWCADLSGAQFPTEYNLGKKYQLQVYAQKPHVDLQVKKGAAVDGSEDEIRIYVPSEASPIFNSANLDKTTMVYNGKALPDTSFVDNGTEKYWKVGSVAADNIKADLDMYNKPNVFSYKYNTGAFSNASTVGYDPIAVGLFNTPDVTSIDEARIMDVNVTVYPYIMYVHPATKSGVNYYSGTLWLDYNSIVPEGTTAYIATGVKKDYVIDSNEGTDVVDYQLVLEELGGPGNGGPGAIVPAGTAIFVRSNTKAGLYAFQKAWEVDYQGWEGEAVNSGPDDNVIVGEKYTPAQLAEIERTLAWIGDRNLLEGAGVPTEFPEKRQCLTLGRNDQRGTMMIGFWPYNGTVVAPHRAFIREARYREALSKLQGSNSGAGSTGNLTGATFYFGEDDSEPLIIETIDSGVPVASESWYTMNGQRLFGRPTKQGVYIHNGKKVYIK